MSDSGLVTCFNIIWDPEIPVEKNTLPRYKAYDNKRYYFYTLSVICTTSIYTVSLRLFQQRTGVWSFKKSLYRKYCTQSVRPKDCSPIGTKEKEKWKMEASTEKKTGSWTVFGSIISCLPYLTNLIFPYDTLSNNHNYTAEYGFSDQITQSELRERV